jgi:hypothetical protein
MEKLNQRELKTDSNGSNKADKKIIEQINKLEIKPRPSYLLQVRNKMNEEKN